MRRFPLHKIPNIVPLCGILLSVLLASLSWGIGIADAVDSVILGLMGTVLSVQFEILVRHEENSEFAELFTGAQWLRDPLKSAAVDGGAIGRNFGGTPVENEARNLVQDFGAELNSLSLGRLRRGPEDSHYLIQHTRDAQKLILSVTNIGEGVGNPHWWQEGRGQVYFNENVRAVQRGVVIQRIIIYSESQRAEALELAGQHHEAGIQVKLSIRDGLRPEHRINFAVWDYRVSWEAQMNADGNPIANLYCVGAADLRRLTEIHRALWANALDYTKAPR